MKRETIGFTLVAIGLPLGLALAMNSDAPLFYVLPFTLASAFLLGPLAFRLCVRRRWLSIWHFLLVGFVLGAICTIVFLPEGLLQCMKWALLFGPLGTINAALFWVVVVWQNKQLLTTTSNDTSRIH